MTIKLLANFEIFCGPHLPTLKKSSILQKYLDYPQKELRDHNPQIKGKRLGGQISFIWNEKEIEKENLIASIVHTVCKNFKLIKQQKDSKVDLS